MPTLPQEMNEVQLRLAAQKAATRATPWAPEPARAAAAVHDAPQKGVDMSASQDVHHSAFPFNGTDAKQVDGVAARLAAHEATAGHPPGSPAPARAAAAVCDAPRVRASGWKVFETLSGWKLPGGNSTRKFPPGK